MANTINLIHTKNGLSPQFEKIEKSIKRVSIIAVSLFLFASLITGLMFYYYSSQLTHFEEFRTSLRTQIAASKTKEGLLTSIKDRTRIVERTMATQRPWAETLELLTAVAVPPALSGISIDEQNKIEVRIKTQSIDELLGPVNTFIGYAKEGLLKNPQLTSVQFDKNGEVMVSITFIKVF